MIKEQYRREILLVFSVAKIIYFIFQLLQNYVKVT